MESVADERQPEEDVKWLPSIPLKDAVTGETHALNVAHCTARVALLNHLANNEAIIALYEHYTETTAFGQRITRAATLLDEVAQLLGYDDRRAFHTEEAQQRMDAGTVTVVLEHEPDEGEAERLRHLPQTAMAALEDALDMDRVNEECRHVVDALIHLIRDVWQLNFPWLALELFERWVFCLGYGALGLQWQKTIRYVPKSPLDIPMPAFRLELESRPGETLGGFLARALQEFDLSMEPIIDPALEQAADESRALPNGRRTDPQIIERYVGWWYRNRILEESIRSIARSSAADTRDGDRSHVRYGIRKAEEWLSLSQYGWKDPGEE